MPKDLEYYQEIASQTVENDRPFVEMAQEIDKMWNCEWELPEGMKDKDWMREFITTAPHDAMWAAGRSSVARQPNISVMPFGTADADRAEQIEGLLDWHFFQTVRRSAKNPFIDIAMSAVKYSRVAMQTVYIPHEFKGDKRLTRMRRNGDFALKVHNPQNVHAEYNEFGLESVTLAVPKTGRELVILYPEMEEAIVSQIDVAGDDFNYYLNKTVFTLWDYTDWDDRIIWFTPGIGSNTLAPNAGGLTEIMRKPHGLDFLPWVFKQDDNPLMKPVIDAKLFNNANILESLRYFLVVSTVAQARSWSKTPTGEGVEIDYSEPASQVQMTSQQDFGILQPSQLDPNLSMLIDSVRGDIRQTTVAEALTTIDRLSSGTPFATVNAILQASIESLSPIHKVIENSIEESLYQLLSWVKKSGIALTGYKRKKTSDTQEDKMKGAELILNDTDFDPKDIYLTVTLNTETATDRDAAINRAILVSSRLPISPRKALEDNGYDYNQADFEEFALWGYVNSEHQADMQRILMQPELEAAQMQQQMAMQAQQQQQGAQQQAMQQQAQMSAEQGDMNQGEGGQPIFEGAQGEAGLSPASINPSGTRETMGGGTNLGEPL